MRSRNHTARGVIVALAVAFATPAPALADPGQVYQDFVTNGVLTCKHPQSDLRSVIANAALNQYSDQATMTDLRIAVQRALARGCYLGATPSTGQGGEGLVGSVGVFAAIGGGALLLLAGAGIIVRRTLTGER